LSNTASGGGLYSDSSFTLNGTQFLSNTSRSGNGGGAWTPNSANVLDAYFAYNTVITARRTRSFSTTARSPAAGADRARVVMLH
jgi:hypothetical protein